MLLNSKEVTDVLKAIEVLIAVNYKSDNRYELDKVIPFIQEKIVQMKQEPEIVRKLELYQRQYGINVYNYINKAYLSFEEFKKEIVHLLDTCEKLKDLIIEYRQLLPKIPFNKRRRVEQLLVRPDKLSEAYRMLANIKGGFVNGK